MLPEVVRGRKIRSSLICIKLVYEPKLSLPEIKSSVVPLSASDALYIYENSMYKEYISVDYIEYRIANGIALGIYDGEKLVGWAVTHDDGAIGFLNVLEEYRGKGYGFDITAAMVDRLLKAGEVPFLHIEEENHKSMCLALRAGFKKDRRIHWVKLL